MNMNYLFEIFSCYQETVMQIFRFSANFADFVAKNVIFVNRLNPLIQFGGYGWGCTMHIQIVYMKLIDDL